MNIRVQNGKRTITLTKTERSQMAATKDICCELYAQTKDAISEAASDAFKALRVLLAEFRSDATQSEPAAENGQPETAAAEATTAKVK